MRILFFQPGIGSYRIDFFNALAKKCELKIVYFFDEATEQKFPEPPAEKLKNCQVEKLDGGFDLRKYYPIRPALGKVIRDFNPDVVVGYEFNTLMLHLAILRRLCFAKWKLFLWTSDNLDIAAGCHGVRRFFRRLGTWACDAMLLYSDEVRDFYASKLLSPENCLTLPNIQCEERIRADISNSSDVAGALAQEYKISGKKVLLFVGRLHPVKNIPQLLEAVSQLPEYQLIIVGGGDEYAALEKLCRDLNISDRVHFSGSCYGERLWAHYLLAGALVLPSSFETFGAVVNEALAAGVPCVVSDRIGAKVLIRDPKQGEIFHFGSVEAIVAALRDISSRIEPFDPGKVSHLSPSLMDEKMGDYVTKFLTFVERKISGNSPKQN